MLYPIIIILITIGLFGYYISKYKKESSNAQLLAQRLISLNEEMHEIVVLGLYQRFKGEEERKESSIEFEYFAARVMEDYYGGDTYVMRHSEDYGVDIEHERGDGVYLGRVKCQDPDYPVDFEPIAVVHSQMLKRGAKGGFVVTTSRFTENARRYAEGLNIELIEGMDLVQYWADTVETKRKSAIAIIEPKCGI